MIGIVESGSTKSQWQFVDQSGKYQYSTSGFNPFYQKIEEIVNTIKDELLPAIEFKNSISKIYFYGAGCEAEENKAKMREAFKQVMPRAEVTVMHDLMAAAKALFGDNAGIACISGTGSNTCHYDGKNIVKNIDSLGLFMGDEGSGGYKGKLLLTKYLRKELPSHLIEAFEAEFTDRRHEILSHIYGGKMPSKYIASYAPFLLKHLSEPSISQIAYQSFNDLFENCILKYDNVKSLPIGFVGSIAFHFKESLEKVAESKGLKIAMIDPSPSEALVNYHLQKQI